MKTRNKIQQIAQNMDASFNKCSRIDLTVYNYGEVYKTEDYCFILIDFYVQQEHVAELRYRPLAGPKSRHICRECFFYSNQ